VSSFLHDSHSDNTTGMPISMSRSIFVHDSTEHIAQLQHSLSPIREALLNFDAVSYLKLKRCDIIGNETKTMNDDEEEGNDDDYKIMDDHTYEDVALIDDNLYVKTIQNDILPPNSGIRYLHIAEKTNKYSIGIFVFPPNATIPLHNHPDMMVLSRVLYGDLTVKTFDIIPIKISSSTTSSLSASTMDDTTNNHDNCCEHTFKKSKLEGKYQNTTTSSYRMISRLIPKFMSNLLGGRSSLSSSSSFSNLKDKKNQPFGYNVPDKSIHVYENNIKRISSPNITELYPHKANVHEFTAGENGAAVLDVIVPPYDVDNERDCTFYKKDVTLDVPRSRTTMTSNTTTTITMRSESNGDDINNDYDNKRFKSVYDESRDRCWLVPIPQPEWFHCISGQYKDIIGDNL